MWRGRPRRRLRRRHAGPEQRAEGLEQRRPRRPLLAERLGDAVEDDGDEHDAEAALARRADVEPAEAGVDRETERSEEHTSELQSLMRISYAVFCLEKKKKT